MYLISLYFDDDTNSKMKKLINCVAEETGNTFMIDNNIPPHITLQAFDTRNEEMAIKLFEENVKTIVDGKVFFASIGVLKKQVIYLEPVLNEYLHNLSMETYKIFESIPDIKFSPYYKPFGWIPHLSVGKHLDEIQLKYAFEILLERFSPFKANVTRIGIAKTNPHTDLRIIR